MNRKKYPWWSYAKAITKKYPKMKSGSIPEGYTEADRIAVRDALAETESMPKAEERMRLIRLVLLDGTHTIDGAALLMEKSTRTLVKWHGDFIELVGEKRGLKQQEL